MELHGSRLEDRSAGFAQGWRQKHLHQFFASNLQPQTSNGISLPCALPFELELERLSDHHLDASTLIGDGRIDSDHEPLGPQTQP